MQEAVRQDVEDFGWSVDYATRRRTTSPELKQALRRVHQLPDYVGQYRDDGEGDPLTIVFKDEVPEGALDEVLEAGPLPRRRRDDRLLDEGLPALLARDPADPR